MCPRGRSKRLTGVVGRVPRVWGHDAVMGALLLEAMRDERPLLELGMAVSCEEVAHLIGGLHRSGAARLGGGVVPLGERVEFIFEHWVERHRQRGEAVTRAVPVD